MVRNKGITQNSKVRVAIDAMGGDYAPEEKVKGAVLAAQQGDVEIFLVGLADVLEDQLARYGAARNASIHIAPASEFIGENESPVAAIRHKPACSVAVAAKMVKSGDADAFVSAGNSAAASVGAIQYIGMVDGIYRPAIVGSLGSFAPNTVMVDLGANVDCKPHQFLDFAIVGSVYAKQ
ncbi:MAG: phosphate--acyl-ACP acyltransferase, partial [Dehalococcoidia bacterium]